MNSSSSSQTASKMQSTFDALLSPIIEFLESQAEDIDKQADSRKLFFVDFVRTLIYGVVMQIGSLRLLVTDLATSLKAQALGIPATPFSTLKDGFTRFPASAFHTLFITVLATVTWLPVPEIAVLGKLYLVDGSLFPAIATMLWATYKKDCHAIRLHLAFELNRMIPVEFAIGSGNSNEKTFLVSILQAGITYVLDRGYVCFKLFEEITKAGAFFVIRAKCNLCYTIVQSLEITGNIPQNLFGFVTDAIVTLNNDTSKNKYRLIIFTISKVKFYILTNRLDLNTFQIILIYAYRWQIELIFRFLKRTMNGLHLFNHSENGVQIYFYVLLITALLQLRMKQFCVKQTEADTIKKSETNSNQSETMTKITKQITTPYSFMEKIGENLKKYWKISCHWLLKLRNFLTLPFDYNVIHQLGYG